MTVGTDITEIDRIEEMSRKHSGFISSVFTKNEIAYCQGKRNIYQHFAARFAAKEGVMKAVGRGWLQGLEWTDIEIINMSAGQPEIQAHGTLQKLMREKGITSFAVSMSHCKKYATATVLAMWKD